MVWKSESLIVQMVGWFVGPGCKTHTLDCFSCPTEGLEVNQEFWCERDRSV